ncbi:MAG: ATP-dependent helicase [Ardenticatenaceae bacterium]|nr:ATP-dependent helicase [Ardenticatenaceae bacterium]
MTLYHSQVQELNTKQREAFDSPGNTVVIAGPGSGKTRVLSLKVAKLLRDEIAPPQGIACLTYTRGMARELAQKINSLSVDDRPNVVVDTIHGFCLGYVIRPFSKLYGLDIPYPIRIAPQSVWDECLSIARQEVKGQTYNPGYDQQFKMDLAKYHLQHIDQPSSEWDNQDYAQIIEQHYTCLKGKGHIDFDLIIKYGLDLIANQLFVRQCLYAKFPWFAVDEYQDLGYPLFRIITEMLDKTPINLFAIGDPDQSIYGYMGTDPKYLRDLANRADVPGYVELDFNYRSTKNIIQICKHILDPSTDYDSDIINSDSKCRVYEVGVCHDGKPRRVERVIEKLIQEYTKRGIPLHQIAVLHPWRPNSARGTEGIKFVAKKLKRIGLFYHLDRNSLYDRRMRLIQWLEELAVWCLSGWTTLEEQTSRKCDFEEIQHFWEAINTGQHVSGEYESDLRVALTTALWKIKGQNLSLNDWLNYLQESLDLNEVLTSYGIEFPDEVDEFNKLVELSAANGRLANLHIDKFAHMQSAVQLTTIHSSKGMEFEAVIIVGIERIRNDEDGNRLFYVGATRAKQQLSLIYSKAWPEENPRTPQYINQLHDNCSDFDFFAHHRI